jgi:uncharacterized protein YjiS (DUF1127 family)
MSRAKEKDATEDHLSLDVRALHRNAALAPGRVCSWAWRRRGEQVAAINIEAESRGRLRLRYCVTTRSETESKDYPILITWTACYLGGNRPWFLCPCCGRRVAKLYLRGLFACRHCLRLNYASQQSSRRDRAADRSWDLRRALGCDEGFLALPAEFIAKPKGMHWRTFERKLNQLKRIDARALADVGVVLDSIKRRIGLAESALYGRL